MPELHKQTYKAESRQGTPYIWRGLEKFLQDMDADNTFVYDKNNHGKRVWREELEEEKGLTLVLIMSGEIKIKCL